jgi:hypothetical protein
VGYRACSYRLSFQMHTPDVHPNPFTIHTLVKVNKAFCERTSKATFGKAQISNKLIFYHHDRNNIEYARSILIFMTLHFFKGWQAIKCNKITRKHFVGVFKVL